MIWWHLMSQETMELIQKDIWFWISSLDSASSKYQLSIIFYRCKCFPNPRKVLQNTKFYIMNTFYMGNYFPGSEFYSVRRIFLKMVKCTYSILFYNLSNKILFVSKRALYVPYNVAAIQLQIKSQNRNKSSGIQISDIALFQILLLLLIIADYL